MPVLRVALIGAGPMGASMAANMQRTGRAEMVAFCDRSPVVLQAAAAGFQKETGRQVKCCASVEELYRTAAFDAAIVALSPETQPKLAADLLRRGVHVLCQVPVAFTMEDCAALVDAVRASGAVYVAAEQTREWQFVRAWREMAARGDFGKIIFAEGQYLHYEPKWGWFVNKADGSVLATDDPAYGKNPAFEESWRYRTFRHPILYTPHTLNPLLSVTGGRITKVSCMGTRPQSYYTRGFDVRDMETALMYADNDVVFQVKTGFTSPHGFHAGTGAHWYQIKGTAASVEWARSEIDTPKLYTPEPGTHNGTWQAMPWSVVDETQDELVRASGHGGVDMIPILAFLDAIQRHVAPAMDVYAAVRLAAPAIAAAQSSEQGGALVEVPDFA